MTHGRQKCWVIAADSPKKLYIIGTKT
jgi:hypothetical protein